MLTASAMVELLKSRTIKLPGILEGLAFTSGVPPTGSVKVRPTYFQSTTGEKFAAEGAFKGEIVFEAKNLAVTGIGGVQESRVDKTGSLLLMQVLTTDRTEQDLATKDRLYSTMQIIQDPHGFVCVGTEWAFVLGNKPKGFSERCQIE